MTGRADAKDLLSVGRVTLSPSGRRGDNKQEKDKQLSLHVLRSRGYLGCDTTPVGQRGSLRFATLAEGLAMLTMPKPDDAAIARRREIAQALRAIVPGEGVIESPIEMRAYESDGLTAYRQVPLLVVLP